MTIAWHCAKCGSTGSSTNKLQAASVNEERLARMLHDAVSPNCKPEAGDITVSVRADDSTPRKRMP